MFHTYVKEKNAKKEYRENAFLATAIEDVAKKYNAIKHKRNKGPIVLYDFNENKLYQKRTIRFIAREGIKTVLDNCECDDLELSKATAELRERAKSVYCQFT